MKNIYQVKNLPVDPNFKMFFMLITRTLLSASLLLASLFSIAANDTPALKEKSTSSIITNKAAGFNYTFHIDNTVNKNNTVDSVLVILDKFDHSGAGIVTKVFYPGANNQIVIEGLPAGKYYAEIYVLGFYKNIFLPSLTPSNQLRKIKQSFS